MRVMHHQEHHGACAPGEDQADHVVAKVGRQAGVAQAARCVLQDRCHQRQLLRAPGRVRAQQEDALQLEGVAGDRCFACGAAACMRSSRWALIKG